MQNCKLLGISDQAKYSLNSCIDNELAVCIGAYVTVR